MSYLRSLLLCAVLCACADAYKIMVVFPFASPSHGILGDGVVRHLLNAGHEVTYLTPFIKDKTHPNLRQIELSENKKNMPKANITAIMDKTQNMFDIRRFFNTTVTLFRATILNANIQKLVDDPNETFDLVIVEWMFTELYSGFSAVFNCPFIWLSPTEPTSIVLNLIDETLNPAYNAGIISTNLPPFTFINRAKELLIQIFMDLFKNYYFAKTERDEFETMFGPIIRKRGRPVPDYEDVKYNASLILGNSHVSLGLSTRLPQNYIPVGGYHIDTNIKPLSEDLKKLLDNAKHGVIYFSLGSNLKSKDLPDKVKQELLKMFGSLQQTVLWKFEEELPNMPKNVHILKWAPQPAILSHPNCILFITHGGLLSSTEAVHFGKATIGVPVFADQFTNVERAVRKGFSRRVDLTHSIANDLKVAIAEVLGNPSYSKIAKELSFIFHHRPVSPGAELVHWVEHVIKTNGAPHLRSPALHVPFYQKMYLDLIALILAIVIPLKLVIVRSCRRKRIDSNKKNK